MRFTMISEGMILMITRPDYHGTRTEASKLSLMFLNTQDELRQAFKELDNGTFLKYN
jgi:hypothetical protein